jgi:hypothetical protein
MASSSLHLVEEHYAAQPEIFILPLSYSQQRLWFIQQMDPQSIVYNLPYRVELIGRLNLQALNRSLREIVRRHEILRTCFPARDGMAMQQVSDSTEFNLQFIDLAALSGPDQASIAEDLLRREAEKWFDLERGPLMRACLLQLREQEHVLLITMHHIVTDGWSIRIFAGELGTLYEDYRVGRESSLPELPLQYADYALWQREWLKGERLEKQMAYWRRQLDAVTTLELPTDRPRTAMLSYQGGNVRFDLGVDLSEKLKGLAQREGVTLFMLFLAVFQMLLGNYAGQTDVSVGSVIANRNRKELEGLIGFFVNTLVLRTDLSGDPRFRELLAKVREVTLGAYAHQDIAFEKLVEELSPERGLGRTSLFQAMLVLQNAPETRLELPNLLLKPQDMELDIAKFDLSMAMGESWISSEGIAGSCTYNSDLFDHKTIVEIVEQFKELLHAVVIKPESRISDLPFKPIGQRTLETANDYSVAMDSAQSFRF